MATTTSAQHSRLNHAANEECRLDTGKTQLDCTQQGNQQDLSDKILELARSLRSAPPIDAQTGTQASFNQPRFGDLFRYAINYEDENRLWEKEATRLVDSLKATNETFNPGLNSTFPAAIDSVGFTCLKRLSDHMLCALSICGLDDNAVLETHRSVGSSPNESVQGRSFKKLSTRVGSRPETDRINQARGVVSSFTPNDPSESGGVTQEASLPMAALNDADAVTYYLLVDYITATLARLLSTGFTRHQIYWLGIIINVLAKFSTKLKGLSHDLRSFATEAVLLHGNLCMCRDLHEFSTEDNMSDIKLDRVNIDQATGSSDSYLADYISDMGLVSNWLFCLAWHILTDLNTRNTRAGSRGLSTLAYQNRPGHISGSSSSVAVGMYHRAFDIMMDTAISMRKPMQDAQMARVSQSTVSIGAGKSFPDQIFKIESMADLISIMVVFSCMDPTLTEDMVTELHTSESMRRRISASARGWAVEERAISVSCLRYTISVMTGCTILVLGGLMAGFFVGSRIDGVDPFNLTMFAWIIAAFIMVVCKSLRVAEWTWRDFLKGRVTCRSVRELPSVTNLDEQGIIMHLMSSENELHLKLRGPYNSAFANTDSEGFSVDIKPNIGTLFVSGLVVLEVLKENGSALVCLDLRPEVITTYGARNKAASRRRIVHGQRDACFVLACMDPPQEGESEKDITFRWQWLSWEKIIGLYNNPSQSVR
ncbi:unnamed protein product [Fusarium equiseti]|uniref:Uncharacterized protein n=1 Tax=Fusarium equiseti TaxID=61235 RepID=A0A8J2J6T4_FUSEQ|nr:unnamed protein product [Fusarium equiseti]